MKELILKELVEKIRTDMNRQLLTGSTLLNGLAVLDESARKSSAYVDHKYAPFYYYLGKHFPINNLIEFGFNLGFFSCAYIKAQKDIKNFLAFNEKHEEQFAMRLGKSNIKKVYRGNANFYSGKLFDEEFITLAGKVKWDLVLLNTEFSYDETLNYLDFVYPLLSEQAVIVIDFFDKHAANKDAFQAFSFSKNRKLEYIKTRYGIGMMQKS